MKKNQEHGDIGNAIVVFVLVGFLGFGMGKFWDIKFFGTIVGLISGFCTWYFKPISDSINNSQQHTNTKSKINNSHETISTVNITNNITVKTPKKKYNKKAPHCPKCKSNNIQILDNKRKAFSIGKAAVGGVVFGAIGATIGGFSGKKGKKYNAVCMSCGKKFTIKF